MNSAKSTAQYVPQSFFWREWGARRERDWRVARGRWCAVREDEGKNRERERERETERERMEMLVNTSFMCSLMPDHLFADKTSVCVVSVHRS